jgi:hypothetical protein
MVASDIRICFVGDSFVDGTCDPDYLGWTGSLTVVLNLLLCRIIIGDSKP